MSDTEWFTLLQIALELVLLAALIVFAKRLHALTTALEGNSARLEATVDRIEAADRVVAENLEASIGRANATDGPEGAAADAALRSKEK